VARVERGDLDVEVPVYDGSELGLLQAGFNSMVAGLRDRERVKDLFGRYVGRDVVDGALERGIALGGEVRNVAVLFVDIVGSTAIVSSRPPTDVVALLNAFFAVVVDVIAQHKGWVNKFQGDAALAVFGAPVPLRQVSACALAAARVLAERLQAEVPQVQAAIGVSAGRAVAGNIGDQRRFEYTVIGDPVHEAARLTELAKSIPGGVVASASAVETAGPEEARHWRLGEQVTLRGRTEPTRLATPYHAEKTRLDRH
jgi:adenylate cyclase